MIGKNVGVIGSIIVLNVVAGGNVSVRAQDSPPEKGPLFKVENTMAKSIAFAPDGQILACDLVFRNLAGKEVARGDVGSDLQHCMYVAFSPDGKRLASIQLDGKRIREGIEICLWNISDDDKLQKAATLQLAKSRPRLYYGSLRYLTFSPDGKLLAAREPDGSTLIWEAASGKELRRLETQGLALTFAPGGRTLTSVTRDGLVEHWDLPTKKCMDHENKRTDFLYVENAFASADGKTLALMDGYSVVLKDALSGRTLRHFDNLQAGQMALSPDGKTLAVSVGGEVVLYDRETGNDTGHLNTSKTWVHALAFSPDAKFLAVSMEDIGYGFSLSVWETAKLAPTRKREIETSPIQLEAKLTSKKDTYTLDLESKTPEEFAKQIRSSRPPQASKVDLVLTLCNKGDKTLSIDPDIMVRLHLVGVGAMNLPEEIYSTEGRSSEMPKDNLTIAPGKTCEIPIK